MQERTPAPDEVRRFVFEDQPVRGHWVQLESAWSELRAHQHYPQAVRELLGQAVSASVLLAATLKFEGELTLQLQGPGVVSLLVAQCTHDFRVRAVARCDEERLESPQFEQPLDPQSFRELVGEQGRFVVTIEATGRDMRYQGIVPLDGDSLAECLETYFASSEQLPTRVQLVADDHRTAGLLVQRVPGEGGSGAAEESTVASAWSDAELGIERVSADQLLQAGVESVLARGFGQRDVRLFAGSQVRFACRCGPARVAGLLRALGADEVRDVLREQGSVTVTCEFCQRPYRFDAFDVEQLFAPGARPDGSASVH